MQDIDQVDPPGWRLGIWLTILPCKKPTVVKSNEDKDSGDTDFGIINDKTLRTKIIMLQWVRQLLLLRETYKERLNTR
ncbi:hypothetical protein TNCV_1078681 [Trichonephila clavipes]|nr:hypothetical protein TNCV_1078681 [Trichonephila clavipes]